MRICSEIHFNHWTNFQRLKSNPAGQDLSGTPLVLSLSHSQETLDVILIENLRKTSIKNSRKKPLTWSSSGLIVARASSSSGDFMIFV